MPLTPEQKARALAVRGLDSSSWDVDDQGNFLPKAIPQEQPSTAPEHITQTAPQTSTIGALGAHAASGAIPTAVGLGTGALATSMLNPWAHVAPPWSEIW